MSSRAGALVAAVLALAVFLAQPVTAARLVAIADIHGAHDELMELLQTIELADADGNWIGGDATLVQTGDLYDRGLETRAVIETLKRLQEQASDQGGEVIVLLGNHEAMNLIRVTRDVNPEAYQEFAVKDSERRRDQAYKDYATWLRKRSKELGGPKPKLGAQHEKEWKAARPPGYLEYLDALGPDGEIGSWLRTLDAIAVVDGIVFVHGGLSPDVPEGSIEEINQRVRREMGIFDRCVDLLVGDGISHATSDAFELVATGQEELKRILEELNHASERDAAPLRGTVEILKDCNNFNQWYLLSGDGPLWFRGFARWGDEEGPLQLQRLADRFGVTRFVVGHTPQPELRILTRFDGAVALIDTGMLKSAYNGRASALEIRDDGRTFARYVDGDVEVDFRLPEQEEAEAKVDATDTAMQWKGKDGKPLPFSSDAELVRFLETAPIVDAARLDAGINRPYKVTLRQDGVQLNAVFRSVDSIKPKHRMPDGHLILSLRDSYRYEVAAYRLSTLLGLDRVPPAVGRRYNGTDGSLQLWVENSITEEKRQERGLKPKHPYRHTVDRMMLRVFDALIQNVDRNQGNILFEEETGAMRYIDHTRSFVANDRIAALDDLAQCEVRVWERLKSLSEEDVARALDSTLNKGELRALMNRWAIVVQHFEKLLENNDADAVLIRS